MDKFNQFDGVLNWMASLMWEGKLPKQLKKHCACNEQTDMETCGPLSLGGCI